ncbi:hypothetical protein [Paenibacillus alginolyticus]|nr:hypothetical protein [Paenibacillus alginolyticus]
MSRVLIRTGINETMVAPLTRFMRTPAFWGDGYGGVDGLGSSQNK